MLQTGLADPIAQRGPLQRQSTAFVDYDEIDSLLKGIDYISKLDSNATSMVDFEATYVAKGDLLITTLDSGTTLVVSSGRIVKISASFDFDNLAELKKLIEEGKAMIDSTAKNSKQ